MHGYRVVPATSDRNVGQIIGTSGDYYIVKRAIGRGCYPLPKEYATVIPEEDRVRMHMSKEMLFGAPKVGRDGEFDEVAAAEYFGNSEAAEADAG